MKPRFGALGFHAGNIEIRQTTTMQGAGTIYLVIPCKDETIMEKLHQALTLISMSKDDAQSYV
jgi:hypothetical protein